MAKERFIDLQLIKPVDPGSSGSKGKIPLRKLLKEYFNLLNVGYVDPCCDPGSEGSFNCPAISTEVGNTIICNEDGIFSLGGAPITPGFDTVLAQNEALTVNRIVPLNAKNLQFVNGYIGIQITPTAHLHLAGSGVTPGNAPLKFANGSLLTTPENGAVEFDGVHFYGTIGSTRFRFDQQFNAENGLTKTGTTVATLKLGGALTENTTITTVSGTSFLTITGNNTSFTPVLAVTNTTFGMAISATSAGGTAVRGITTGGIGVQGSSTTTGGTALVGVASLDGIGVVAQSTTGIAMKAIIAPSTANTVNPIVEFHRNISGGAVANGIGLSLDLYIDTQSSPDILSNQVISKWTNSIHAVRSSQFEIWGVNTAVTEQHFTLKSTGQQQLNKFGIGTFTGTPTYTLQVDASGNIIESAVSLTPTISSGVAAPATTPGKVGDMFVDTTNKKLYIATGNASSADWTITN